MDVYYRNRLRVSPSGGSALREAGGNCDVDDGVSSILTTSAGAVFHDRVFRDRMCVMFLNLTMFSFGGILFLLGHLLFWVTVYLETGFLGNSLWRHLFYMALFNCFIGNLDPGMAFVVGFPHVRYYRGVFPTNPIGRSRGCKLRSNVDRMFLPPSFLVKTGWCYAKKEDDVTGTCLATEDGDHEMYAIWVRVGIGVARVGRPTQFVYRDGVPRR